MNVIARRIAAGVTLAAAPALIALGVASASQAETTATHTGPSVSSTHQAFPHQDNIPQPGSRVHHHHQWNHAK